MSMPKPSNHKPTVIAGHEPQSMTAEQHRFRVKPGMTTLVTGNKRLWNCQDSICEVRQ